MNTLVAKPVWSDAGKSLNHCFARGAIAEKAVKASLAAQGFEITPSTKSENRDLDIDCYINDVPLSIKAEHAGVRYGDIYFELFQQLTSHSGCLSSRRLLKQLASTNKPDYDSVLQQLLQTGSWEDGWWYSGKAQLYAILQGQDIRLYLKEHLVRHWNAHGWRKVRSLSSHTKSYLGGKYRYCNSVCGFIKPADVQCVVFPLLD